MGSITLLAVLFLSLSYYGVRGSEVEVSDSDLEKIQKFLDKPFTKTIKIAGDIFDCVDLGSQPAFDHPLLKNHIADLRALIRSKPTDKKYFGAEGQINIQNPPVGPGQFSSAQIWIESADLGANFNALQAGWAGSDPKVNCFNLHCSGFVQVDRSHPIGGLVEPVSKYGGEQHELALAISLDPKTKDWWLVNWGGLSRDDYIHYGYWPKELFPSFQGGADYVAWGGAVHPGKNETSPPMGTGHFDGNFVQTSYIKEIEVYVDENGNLANPIVSSFAPLAENSKCFGVQDLGYDDDSLYRFTFGGPGGICRA
ncbi:hypothetical protein IFM89_015280 [Coptis chinensis]|uniref:Neprosin PEP catalytic domain-containing protein n=1 Tax=Coptis chinensis TaxID=261450 RepID=A0A835HD17_9MAGN|nr:hypothetical protein IFM89_015280 [Coptis chinensis]